MKLKGNDFDNHMINTIKIAIVIVMIFSIINISHYYVTMRTIRDNLVETTLQETKNYISTNMHMVNKMHANTSSLLAEIYSNKIQQGHKTSDTILDLKLKQDKLSVKNVGLVDLTKNIYLDSFGQVLNLDLNSNRDKWIKEFIDKPQDYEYYFYDPNEAKYEPLYSFFHNVKIRDNDGRVIGITGIGLGYDAFYDKFNGLNDNVSVYFLNSKGDVRLPKDKKDLPIKSIFPYISEKTLKSTIRNSNDLPKDNIIWHQDKNRSDILYFHYLSDINTTLLLKIGITKLYNLTKLHHFISFIVGLTITILVVVISLFKNLYENKKLNKAAYYDSLTMCHNRHYLNNITKKIPTWNHIKNSGYSMSIFDIDHFKDINDKSGHQEGDKILKQVAFITKNCLRDSDELIRWGGDEFLIILDMTSQEAVDIVNRIRIKVESETSVSLSVGVTDILVNDSFQSAIDRADSALYDAKNNGRNQIKVRYA